MQDRTCWLADNVFFKLTYKSWLLWWSYQFPCFNWIFVINANSLLSSPSADQIIGQGETSIFKNVKQCVKFCTPVWWLID